jgi:transposase
MLNAYPVELRERVIAKVENGASRREAVRRSNGLLRWRDDGSATAMPHGGSTSPLEKQANWLLTLIAKQPDLTLDEVLVVMHKRRIAGSRTALWQFFA